MILHLQACLPKSTPAGFTVVNYLRYKSARMTFAWAPPTLGSLQSIVGRSLADCWYEMENLQHRDIFAILTEPKNRVTMVTKCFAITIIVPSRHNLSGQFSSSFVISLFSGEALCCLATTSHRIVLHLCGEICGIHYLGLCLSVSLYDIQ